MNIEEAKTEGKNYIEFMTTAGDNADWVKVLLAELDEKDKIINEMAEMLEKDHEWFYSKFDNYKKQDFIDYFTKKVTKED